MHEKPFFQKLNQIADWVIRIVLLNVLLIISMLGVITFYLGLSAVYNLFLDYTNGDDTPLFKGFWNYFKEDIKKKLLISLILIIFVFMGVLNTMNYLQYIKEQPTVFYMIGYYVTFTFTIGFALITLFTLPSRVIFPKLGIKNLFKLSFYLSGRFILRTFLILIVYTGSFLMLFYPFTIPFFMVLGLSAPLLIQTIIQKRVILYLKKE